MIVPSTRANMTQTGGVLLTAGLPLGAHVPAPYSHLRLCPFPQQLGCSAELVQGAQACRVHKGERGAPSHCQGKQVSGTGHEGASPTAVRMGGTCQPAVTPPPDLMPERPLFRV